MSREELEEQIKNMQGNEQSLNDEQSDEKPIAEFGSSGSDFKYNYEDALKNAGIDPSDVYDPMGILGKKYDNKDAKYELTYTYGGADGLSSDDNPITTYGIIKRKTREEPIPDQKNEQSLNDEQSDEKTIAEFGSSGSDFKYNYEDALKNAGIDPSDVYDPMGILGKKYDNKDAKYELTYTYGGADGQSSDDNPITTYRIIKRKTREEPIPDPKKEQNRMPVTSGLQIFRKVLNDAEMPEIENKHTLTSNPLVTVAPSGLMVASAVFLSTYNPILAIGGGVAGAIAGPFVTKVVDAITKRKKITRQIYDVISKLPDNELQLMISYLTEEQIINLKVNDVFLKALGNVLKKRADGNASEKSPKYVEGRQKLNEMGEKYRELQQKLQRGGLSEEEKASVEKELNECSERILQKRKELETLKNSAQRQYVEYKEVRRAARSKGYFTKHNIRGSVFAKKNPTSKEYLPAINEYADAEIPLLEAKAIENDKNATQEEKRLAAEKTVYGTNAMEDIEAKYTVERKIGKGKLFRISTGQFNFPKGIFRKVSDEPDRAVQDAIAILTIVAGTCAYIRTEKLQQRQYDDAMQELHRERNHSDTLSQELDNTIITANRNVKQYNSLAQKVTANNNRIQNLGNGIDLTAAGRQGAINKADGYEMLAMRQKFNGDLDRAQYAAVDRAIQTTFSNDLSNANQIKTVSDALEAMKVDPNIQSGTARLIPYFQKTGPANHANTYGNAAQTDNASAFNMVLDRLKDLISNGKITVGGPQNSIVRATGQPIRGNLPTKLFQNIALPIVMIANKYREKRVEKNETKEEGRGDR